MKGNIHILNEALVMLPSSIAQIQKGRSKLFGVFQYTPPVSWQRWASTDARSNLLVGQDAIVPLGLRS